MLLVGTMLSACAPFVRPEQPQRTDIFVLQPGKQIGQTLVANFNGLSGVQVYLIPSGNAQGRLILHLREDAKAKENLATAYLPVQAVTTSGFYRFTFPVQRDSRQQYYYFGLEFEGEGAVQIGRASGNVYLDGAAYRADKADDDAQLTFLLEYDSTSLVLGILNEWLTWGGYLLLAGFLFVLPGWVVLRGRMTNVRPTEESPITDTASHKDATPTTRHDFWSLLALAAGIGFAIYPLFLLWTDSFALHLGRWYAFLPGIVSLGWFVLQLRALRGGLWRKKIVASTSERSYRPRRFGVLLGKAGRSSANWLMLLILALIVFSRFWGIRTLEGAMWGDGMQHTMITQLLLDNAGLFESWSPYAPLKTFTYHFGFHTAAAIFAWSTGLEARFAVLWMGQILNVLAVLVLYPLAWKIGGGNQWAGIGALLVAGLLSSVPMFYVNWGRYTQLAGQILLPAALYFTWDWLDRQAPLHPRELTIGAILWSGLGLTHYRVLIMGIVGMFAYLLLYLRRATWRRLLTGMFTLGVVATLLVMPWYLRAFTGRLVRIFTTQLTSAPASKGSTVCVPAGIDSLGQYISPWLWLAFLFGLGLILWQRRQWANIFALWGLLLIVVACPQWLGLPGKIIVSYFTVLIAVYILVAVVLGATLPLLANVSRWQTTGLVVLLLAIGVFGMFNRLNEVVPQKYAMLTRPDIRAARWIRDNTAPDAYFLIESFTAYSGNVAVGADGGWWLSILTGRAVSHPPLLYAFESDPYAGFRQGLLELTNTLRQQGVDAPETLAILQKLGLSYVYIGQQQGRVNSTSPALPPQDLLASPHYRLVYRQDRVWIFRITPAIEREENGSAASRNQAQ